MNMNMRSLALAICLLALAGAGVAVTSGVVHGQQDGETIHVYKSPT
jgi:hypothetical protein